MPDPARQAIHPARPGPLPAPADGAGRSVRIRAAWIVAMLVDALQLATAPAQLAGPMEWVVGTGVDLVTALAMMLLLGFHWAFLPSFVTELVPIVDLAPTWTLAVFIVTRTRKGAGGGPAA